MSSLRIVTAIAVRPGIRGGCAGNGHTVRIGSRQSISIVKPISALAAHNPVHGAVPAKAASMTSLARVGNPPVVSGACQQRPSLKEQFQRDRA